MALTNALLKSFGIEQEQRDAIMAAHQETLESIKAERDELQDKAAQVPDLEKQIEALKAADKSDEWKAKCEELSEANDKLQTDYDALKADADKANAEHEEYVKQVEADKSKADKLSLYKELLEEIGLDKKRIDKVAKLKNLDELTVSDGKLEGYDELKASEAEEWAEFIPQPQGVKGQSVPTPPKTEPTGEQPNPRAVQIAKERHEKMYGKSEEQDQ